MGELLAEMPKASGGENYKTTGTSAAPVVPTLAEQGITKKQSARWPRGRQLYEGPDGGAAVNWGAARCFDATGDKLCTAK